MFLFSVGSNVGACLTVPPKKKVPSLPKFNIILIFKMLVPVLQVSFPVDYTPRKFVIHHESAHLIITETEHNAYTEDTKKQRRIQMAEVCV